MAGLDETGRLAIYWILIKSREVRSMAGEIPVFISPIDVEIEGNTGRYDTLIQSRTSPPCS